MPTDLVNNILAVLDRATPDDIVAGASWYTDANALAGSLDSDITKAAGVIAVLSPQLSWTLNQKLAIQACRLGVLSGGCLGRSVAKANAILSGTPAANVVSGKKVTSFYDNILHPHGDSVTIDRHAVDAAYGYVGYAASPNVLSRKGGYEMVADAYRTAAASVGISAPTLQAIVWVAWRREKGLTWAG